MAALKESPEQTGKPLNHRIRNSYSTKFNKAHGKAYLKGLNINIDVSKSLFLEMLIDQFADKVDISIPLKK